MTFYAYEVAIEVIRLLPPVMESVKKRSADLADQIERAATSVVLNLCEGNRRTGKDKLRFFRMAESSANELRGALHIVEVWGYADTAVVGGVLNRELGLLWGLTHSKKLGGSVGSVEPDEPRP